MARIRTVKPEFFRHHDLYQAEIEEKLPLRVAFSGLWTACDRDGRFKWEPDNLKLDCLPYDKVDFSRVLDALTTRGFIEKYASEGRWYGWVPSFLKHQVINNRERPSELPDPLNANLSTRAPRVEDACPTPLNLDQVEGKGKEGKGKEGGVAHDAYASSAAASPVFIKIPLIDKTEYEITQNQVDQWKGLYLDVDVEQELRNYLGWAISKPQKRKTKKGIIGSINFWLSDKQDKGRSNGNSYQKPMTRQEETFAHLDELMAREENGKPSCR